MFEMLFVSDGFDELHALLADGFEEGVDLLLF
jgi:hypothetical protein